MSTPSPAHTFVHARQYLLAVFRACVLTRRRYTSDSLPRPIYIIYTIDYTIDCTIDHRPQTTQHRARCPVSGGGIMIYGLHSGLK